MRRLQLFLAAVGLLVLATGGQAAVVDVSLEPSTGTVVGVGETFDLELWFRSSTTGVIVHELNDLGLHWDPAYVSFDGPASTADGAYAWSTAMSGPVPSMDLPMYPPLRAENATYTDGDAELMLYPGWDYWYGMSKPTTDQHQLTFTFTALALTDSTPIWLTTSDGVWAEWYNWEYNEWIDEWYWRTYVSDLTGSVTGADVKIIPEPASLIIWGLLASGCAGLSVWRRRRRGATRAPWTEENRQAIRQIVGLGHLNK